MLTREHVDNSELEPALAAMGLRMESAPVEDAPFELLPDVAEPFSLFVDMLTQWNMGPGGPVGLRYDVLDHVMRWRAVPADRHGALFDDLRLCERTALDVFEEERARTAPKH